MAYNPDIHHRHSIRLRGYDYSLSGAYFVTVCAHDRECLFGAIVDSEMRLSEAGQVVRSVWEELPKRFPSIKLDTAVVMPNHFHGIVVLTDTPVVGAGSPRPISGFPGTEDEAGNNGVEKQGGETPPLRATLGQIVGYFKYQSTKKINQVRGLAGHPLWQRNYYEHVIRNEDDLAAVRQYIADNPMKWEQDRENPINSP